MPSKYRRKSQLRDPYKRIVIASEGNKTEPEYFEAIRNNCRVENVNIVIIKRNPDNTRSAPVHVLGELDSYKKKYGMKKMDELWLIIDKDRWPESRINQVLSDCSTRKFHAALSNPCFEIWLILHSVDLTQLTETELARYAQRGACKEKVKSLFRQYPVVTITGPRQSGKTTLSRQLFPKKPYVNLENPDTRQFAIGDPRGLLNQYPNGAIFDEIQRAPDIPSYMQGIVDEKKKAGMFILTGSQQLEISQTISQSLAGRTALVKLLPLSSGEINSTKPWKKTDTYLLKGGYPGLVSKKIDPRDFFANYMETYIERDIRQLSQIDNFLLFEKCVRLLAGRCGQLLNYNSLANDLGVSQPTVNKWVTLLQASYILFLLPPFFRNINKRLIKTPKVFFYDTGLVSHLLGIKTESHLIHHPLRGHLFENFIVTELLKTRFNQGRRSNLSFYRDRTGNEVDIILESANKLTPIDVKSAATASPDFFKGILKFQKLFPSEANQGYILYTGTDAFKSRGNAYLPWQSLESIPGLKTAK